MWGVWQVHGENDWTVDYMQNSDGSTKYTNSRQKLYGFKLCSNNSDSSRKQPRLQAYFCLSSFQWLSSSDSAETVWSLDCLAYSCVLASSSILRQSRINWSVNLWIFLTDTITKLGFNRAYFTHPHILNLYHLDLFTTSTVKRWIFAYQHCLLQSFSGAGTHRVLVSFNRRRTHCTVFSISAALHMSSTNCVVFCLIGGFLDSGREWQYVFKSFWQFVCFILKIIHTGQFIHNGKCETNELLGVEKQPEGPV